MQPVDLRNQLYLRWRKIISITLLTICIGYSSFAQNNPSENLINYDEQWIHYGFLLGLHSSKYVIKYSEFFNSPLMDTVHSIIPGNLGGFKLGFVINMKVLRYLDFRILPTVGFYENNLTYRYTDDTSLRELKDATMVELPLLLKYKSARRGNLAMYMIFGINPSLEASGKGLQEDTEMKLELKNWDAAIDVGVGLDIFYPYFKFSPEIRYSYGLRNMLTEEPNAFSEGLSRLSRQNIGLFFTFEGGPPSEGKISKKNRRSALKAREVDQIKERQKKRLK